MRLVEIGPVNLSELGTGLLLDQDWVIGGQREYCWFQEAKGKEIEQGLGHRRDGDRTAEHHR